MGMASETTVTRLLHELRDGHQAALDQLIPLVHEELRLLAHHHRLRWHGDETLGTTALVNEAYLKLVGQQQLGARSRAHFFAVAGKAMRHILANYAESRRRLKRGGGQRPEPLEEAQQVPAGFGLSDDEAEHFAALDAALDRLEGVHPRLSRVVECRFFAGLSIADTAAALGTSPATVKRDWLIARAWLYRELEPQRHPGP
jgi:RNA polymerase sigma factor (TIGR02999 family)